ncbi:hypothetical protein HY604_03485 [Candidatus Peregrinibacteria bacterium]|nr:hypothetical protein [Candidatus Peregrinibacteria bacterium]
MKLKDFKKKMQKNVFTTAQAHVIAFRDNPKLINLQLHQWKKSGDVVQLKRGVFMFADSKPVIAEIAGSLCSPCYFSLEYALSLYGIMPEAVFSYTLVTTKKTQQFKTPVGNFIYQSIKKEAFTGFDVKTLIADPEKALVDYFYLNSSRLGANEIFWEESRLNGSELDFSKVFYYAKLFKSGKLITLLKDFKNYAKT